MNINIILIKLGLSVLLSIFAFILPVTSNIEFLILLAAYFISGYSVLYTATKKILRGNMLDEDFLMGIATIGALIIGETIEAVAVMVFYQIGEAFQTYAVGKSRRSIADLMDIKPEYAVVKRNDEELKVAPQDVAVGEIIVVKPGEKIPLDGVILSGASSIDTKSLTGESLPLDVETGSEVYSGCVNLSGLLSIEVSKEYSESTVAKILELVENASSRKSKSEKFITKFARYYTPTVVILAIFIAILLPFVSDVTWDDSIYRSLSFLVISCPCALVISIPLGFFGGIGGMAKAGILIKGSNYIESLANTEVVLFDKTGTLTQGIFSVIESNPMDIEKQELIDYAAIAETYSAHPIAVSIVNESKLIIDKSKISKVEEISGFGVSATYDNHRILVGNDKLMENNNISYNDVTTIGSVVHVALDKKYIGNIVVADEIKLDAHQAIIKLKNANVKKTVMLTGDRQSIANQIGTSLGIDEVHAELLPADKVDIAEKELQLVSEKKKLAFVGDGINDAPVIARADVGIAMGAMGSEAAIEAADVVIMNDSPLKISAAIKIAKNTLQIVKQNIALAFIVKGAILLLAGFGHSSLWEAIIADVGVAILAILNSMRVMNVKNIE